jgi:hypothetical protein
MNSLKASFLCTCLFLLFTVFTSRATSSLSLRTCSFASAEALSTGTVSLQHQLLLESPILRILRKKKNDNRRLIAACLAFPLPFGFFGGHRLFLGTKPYIPIVYVATLGGCLGAIPLVDFFVIIFTKDLEQYLDNPKVFMWVK